MRKLILVFAVFTVGYSCIGQNNKVVAAYNLMKPGNNKLDKAKDAIDDAVVHPQTKTDPKAWYYRGIVYYEIYKSPNSRINSLDPDPLEQAYFSFVKAKELDNTNSLEEGLLFRLTQNSAEHFNKGSAEFAQGNFEQSVKSFETVLAICQLPCINQIDTGSFYNAALASEAAANQAKDKGIKEKYYQKAVKYYQRAIDLKYGGSDVYAYLADIYLLLGDTASARDTYKGGGLSLPKELISSIPDGSISPVQGLFRLTQWGMNKEQVMKVEKEELSTSTKNLLVYNGKWADLNTGIYYEFANDFLYKGAYSFIVEHTNKNDYIIDFENIKRLATAKYGVPLNDNKNWKNNLYSDDQSQWGFAVSMGHLTYRAEWITKESLITLYLGGDNFEFTFMLIYESTLDAERVKKIKEQEILDELFPESEIQRIKK